MILISSVTGTFTLCVKTLCDVSLTRFFRAQPTETWLSRTLDYHWAIGYFTFRSQSQIYKFLDLILINLINFLNFNLTNFSQISPFICNFAISREELVLCDVTRLLFTNADFVTSHESSFTWYGEIIKWGNKKFVWYGRFWINQRWRTLDVSCRAGFAREACSLLTDVHWWLHG